MSSLRRALARPVVQETLGALFFAVTSLVAFAEGNTLSAFACAFVALLDAVLAVDSRERGR